VSREAHRVGITPYFLRLAAHYASLGVGEYRPKGYAQFDRVGVRVGLPWKADPQNPMDSMLVLIVEFFSGDEVARYVEFALVPAGFGGKPLVSLVGQ
jgi:hypothetical protein